MPSRDSFSAWLTGLDSCDYRRGVVGVKSQRFRCRCGPLAEDAPEPTSLRLSSALTLAARRALGGVTAARQSAADLDVANIETLAAQAVAEGEQGVFQRRGVDSSPSSWTAPSRSSPHTSCAA
jgi:hypothetical protein